MKMITQFRLVGLVLLLLTGLVSYGQDRNVSGKITDDSDAPLPGVSVVAKGTKLGTTTNAQGEYSLNVPTSSNTLVFSYIGYKTIELAINNQSSISLKLEATEEALGELVVVGYGTQKKSSLTGAVSSVTPKDLKALPVVSVTQALQGRVPLSLIHI